jgi:hypothetical protein
MFTKMQLDLHSNLIQSETQTAQRRTIQDSFTWNDVRSCSGGTKGLKLFHKVFAYPNLA